MKKESLDDVREDMKKWKKINGTPGNDEVRKQRRRRARVSFQSGRIVGGEFIRTDCQNIGQNINDGDGWPEKRSKTDGILSSLGC